ncbi:MAG: hypothetical protein AB1489_25015 [Acidobacteriota bacterium]
MHKQLAGYSLVELILVAAIILIAATAVAVNIGPTLVSVEIEQVASQVAASVNLARRAAMSGKSDTNLYEFDLNKSVITSHPGITLSEQAPSSTNSGCQTSCPGQQMLCISGKAFCYSSGKSFSFEPFSGRLTSARALFLLSRSRRLAVLVSENGKTEIAELVNGVWRARTELLQLQATAHGKENKREGEDKDAEKLER